MCAERLELVFPCDNIANTINIRSCLRIERPCAVPGVRESQTSESSWIVREQPGFGDHSDSPREARRHIVAKHFGRSPASGSDRTVRERPGIRELSDSPGVARLR